VGSLEAWVNDRNTAATALIRGAAFEPVTYAAEMARPSVDDLPAHQLPDSVEIRPVSEDQLRAIWEAEAEAFRDHWGYVEPTEASYDRFLAFPYNDLTLWRVAWDDEGVAGQVRSFIDTAQNVEHGRQRGWTEAISTGRSICTPGSATRSSPPGRPSASPSELRSRWKTRTPRPRSGRLQGFSRTGIRASGFRSCVVGRVGIEPTTLGLKVPCSAN